MYENPKLNRVGEIEEVVLGVFAAGDDHDGFYVSNPFEFAPDGELSAEEKNR